MEKHVYRLIKLCLLTASSFFVITACSQSAIRESQNFQVPSSECRVIQHQSGETCVPLKPQRIIALDPEVTLDPLIAFGIEPVGFGKYDLNGEDFLLGVSFDEVEEAENVGDAYRPSLEKIKLLKPDLILSTESNDYSLLSRIAPTVPVPFPNYYGTLAHEAFFKENLRYVAKVFGLEEEVDVALNQYQERIEKLKEIIDGQLDQEKIAVIYHEVSYIWTIVENIHPTTTILDDLDLSYASAPPGNGEWNLNVETIIDSEYDADILFIVDISERGMGFYSQHPIFGNLKAIKHNRAYLVNQQDWRVLGISGANKTLDDLFRYLPEAIETR